MITLEDLQKKCEEYKEIEGRANFYELSLEIIENYPLQASIIILATWNAGRFRFMVSDPQNVVNLRSALKECEPIFEELKHKKLVTANYDEIGDKIKEVYSSLSKVRGVEYTGASKVFHLFCKELIVMWDDSIRDYYEVGVNKEDFLKFQKKMQEKFGHLEWNNLNKSLAKAIDEHNYVKYSFHKKKLISNVF